MRQFATAAGRETDAGGCRDFPYGTIFSSRWSSSLCPDRIFDRAPFRSNQAARSTSGKAAIRPLEGGHSISKELLTSDVVSKSASPQKAITRLPPRWRISPKARNGPIEAAGPSSSANSRRAACSGSSDVSISPFGIDQSSFLRHTGRRGGPTGLRGRAFLGDTPKLRRSTSTVGKFAWTRDGFPPRESEETVSPTCDRPRNATITPFPTGGDRDQRFLVSSRLIRAMPISGLFFRLR
jgi:hypothetical protein